MKKNVLLFALGLLCVINQAFAQQGVLDPNDPIINYDESNPPVMPEPNTLAKWIRTPRPEMYFSTDRFKSYIFNGMPFRLRFPNGYDPSNPDKKYPLILFFHGMGEISPVTDNEFHLYWGAQKFENMINEGQFDAFLFFPTTRDGDWSPSFDNVNMVLDLLQQYCNTDPDRQITMGLSLGGDGAMKYTFDFPKRSAVSIPSSPGSIPTFINNNPTNYLHVPFWISTGEFDEFSPPPTVQAYVNNFRSPGGDVRWTLFPNKGHGTWNEHWDEPYLVPYWNAAHKANPLVFHQQNQFPANTPVNARIGITAGFAQYEWQKDNVTIEGANSNEIVANAPGSYRVRFMRDGSSNWSDWSPNPAVISQAEVTPDNTPPSVPENLQVVSVTASAVTLNWDDASDNTGVSGYEVYVDGNLVATTGSSEYTVENLSPNTSYSFTVVARDQAGNASGSSAAASGTTSALPDTNPPSVPENLQVVSVTANAVTLNWDDASDNTGVSGYEVYVDGNLIATTGSSEYTVENLSPNTSYSFTVVARDQAGNASGSSAAASGTTAALPDTNPPSVPENLQVVSVTANAVTLNWDDAWDNTGVSGYEVYVDGNLIATTGSSEYTVENLSPNTSYSFTVVARDQAGNASGSSTAASGTTAALPDTNPPSVPENLQVVSVTENAVTLNWDDAWDNTGVSGYEVYVDGNLIATTGSSEYTVENLWPNTSYSFTVVARDQAGNASGSSAVASGTTSALPDTNPPSVPENLQVVSVTASAVTLNWDDAWDNTGVNGYEVYVDGNLVATTGSSEYTVENLSPNTSYSFTVVARDQAGNASGSSTAASGTTAALPDVNPPSVPENIQVISGSATSVHLDWEDAWDNTGVSEYEVYVDGNLASVTTGSESIVENLSPNTSYSFTVVARDHAGNASGYSEPVTATTLEEGAFIQNNRIKDINAQLVEKEIIAISGAYPNPFIESFNISIDNPAAGNKINAGIYDLSGKLVYTRYFGNIAAGRTILKMTTGNKQLLPGIYFLRVEVNGKPSKVLKLIKR